MKLAIVTGGSRGLGAALCEEYLSRGWRVVEFSRSAPFAHSIHIDLASPRGAAQVFAASFTRLAADDWREVIAFGNAGVVEPVGPVERLTVDDILANVHTNVASAILFARAFAAAFGDVDAHKTFVNVSSGAAARGTAGWSLYCAGKAALENFVRAAALEQGGRRFPVNFLSVNPGVMDTEMQATVRAARQEDFPARERYARLYAEGRLAEPSLIAARLAAMLQSPPEPGTVYPLF